MADNNGRPFVRSEDRTTRLRVYPVAGTPTEGDGVVVNADLDLEFGASGGCTPEILVDDVSGEILFDDATGDILYDDTSCVGGGGGGGANELDDLTDVVLTSPAAGDLLTFDGSDWVNVAASTSAAEGQDTAAATIYVATTGDDTTGDGTGGLPYLTVGKALSVLPRSLGFLQTIDVADGTYAEALEIEDFICTGAGKILVTGNPTTPTNVTFTGTTAGHNVHGESKTAGVFVSGPVTVELEGLRVNTTADYGVWGVNGSNLTVDRCTVTGTLGKGIAVTQRSLLDLQGNVTVSGFTGHGGVECGVGSRGTFTVAGTLTITGSGTGSWGFHLFEGSTFGIYSGNASGLHITITAVEVGFQVGLNSIFTHQAPSATLTVDNVTTPSGSAGIQCTDCSSWSMNGTSKTLVLDHLTLGVELNSISYAEAVGTRTYTNLGGTSSTTQNSVYYAP